MSDVTDFLSSSDYEKHPPAAFEEIGDKVTGTIVGEPRVKEMDDIFNPGEKVTKLIIELDTGVPYDGEDQALHGDTVRTVWVNKGKMASAINQAVKAAGANKLEEGGKLAVQYVGNGTASQRGWKPPKEYAAKYEAPKGGLDLDDFI